MKILKWTLLTLVGVLIFAIAAGTWYWHSKKPDYAQQTTLTGLQSEVEVLYDEHGIPHIYAQTEEDAFFGLGYCHAQDRLFQMEMLRRLADGHLCEVVGPAALEVDKYYRTLSLRAAAKASIAALYTNPKDSAVAACNAYLRGVNQYIAQGKMPIEFDLMGIPPKPFTLEDCLIVAGYMGLSFSKAFDSEPLNTMILQKFGADYLGDLQTGWNPAAVQIPVGSGAQTDAANLLSLSSALRRIELFCQAIPPFHGSNAWVIAPSRTKSGKVLFENDTHIAFGQPSVFYEAHLNYGGYSLYGNFIAGAPVPVLGHTNTGAWGITMFENDDVDFYREQINPDNPNQVKFKDAWEDMTVRTDTIKVKDGADVLFPVKRTRHGYLMNEVVKLLGYEQNPIAMWWTYYQRPDRSLHAFFKLAHAKDVKDAETAAAMMHAPGLNIMWGDQSGNIAWWAAGLLPKRPAHVLPYLVLDGASGKDEIEGWLPFSENPHSVNPASGYVYSANNQPAQVGKSPLVPGYYVPEDRALRITQFLQTDKKDWTAEAVHQMALDTKNPVLLKTVQDILPILQKTATTDTERKALEMLQKWPGTHTLTDVAPTIFYRWMYYFYEKTYGDELGTAGLKALLGSHTIKRTFAEMVNKDNSKWWDNIATPAKETRAEIIAAAFQQAVADLSVQLGPEVAAWQWQKVHTLVHKHPLGILPAIGDYFNVGPLAVPGGKETVNNLDFHLDSTGRYQVLYGPALRRILDFGNLAQTMSINPTGQSGNIGSTYYSDQAQLYADGKLRHEWTQRKDIERVQTARLVLLPK